MQVHYACDMFGLFAQLFRLGWPQNIISSFHEVNVLKFVLKNIGQSLVARNNVTNCLGSHQRAATSRAQIPHCLAAAMYDVHSRNLFFAL